MDVNVVLDWRKAFDLDRATVIAVSDAFVAAVLEAVMGYLDVRVVNTDANRAV